MEGKYILGRPPWIFVVGSLCSETEQWEQIERNELAWQGIQPLGWKDKGWRVSIVLEQKIDSGVQIGSDVSLQVT